MIYCFFPFIELLSTFRYYRLWGSRLRTEIDNSNVTVGAIVELFYATKPLFCKEEIIIMYYYTISTLWRLFCSFSAIPLVEVL